MLILAISRAPIIFKDAGPACLSGKCPEGDMNCGQREEVIKEFRNLQKAQNYVPRT
jgi:thymidylate synthase (FAD)